MAETRLVLIPYAGAGVSAYRALARLLAPTIEPCGLQLPGREDLSRRSGFLDWDEMISDAARALESLPPGPVAFYGHSLGALVALDLARRLVRAGSRPIRRLFVAARPAPSQAPRDDALLRDAPGLDDVRLMARMAAAYGAPPASFETAEVRDFALPILRADLKLLNSYAYQGPAGLALPITVLTGAADPVTTGADLALWRRETSGAVDFVEVASGHYFIEGTCAAVAAAISGRLP
jgi:surfactin synthase thioesterase subunit